MSQDQFFNLHLTEQQKTQLLIGVNQVCACLQSDHDNVRKSLLQTVEDTLYQQSITACAETDLLTEDHPILRTTADPHACGPVSQDKINNRRAVLRSIWRHTGHNGDPDRAAANEMIQNNIQQNITALQVRYTTAGSWTTMTTAFLQMVKLHCGSQLADQYYLRISSTDPPPIRQKVTISTEDANLIRAANIKLAEQALEINCVQHYLPKHAILALLCWGTSSDHCPQRRSDFRLLKYSDVSVIDGEAVLNFSCSAKVHAAKSVNIAETNPMLSQLLVALKPLAQQDMYLISDRELARSTINDRLQSIYRNAGLEERLCKLASSTNNARHRSVADGKRMSAADQQEHKKRARARLQSPNAADTMYSQDTIV